MFQANETGYVLPDAIGQHAPWRACTSPDFIPSENQQIVIDLVQHALNQGMFYNSDILALVIEQLNLSKEAREANFSSAPVEGGLIGMECYYARQYLTAVTHRRMMQQAFDRLKPEPGLELGSLRFNDLKRKTKVLITKVTDGMIEMTASQGRLKVGFATDALSVKHAMDRAAEKGYRKDDFAAFTAARV